MYVLDLENTANKNTLIAEFGADTSIKEPDRAGLRYHSFFRDPVLKAAEEAKKVTSVELKQQPLSARMAPRAHTLGVPYALVRLPQPVKARLLRAIRSPLEPRGAATKPA